MKVRPVLFDTVSFLVPASFLLLSQTAPSAPTLSSNLIRND